MTKTAAEESEEDWQTLSYSYKTPLQYTHVVQHRGNMTQVTEKPLGSNLLHPSVGTHAQSSDAQFLSVREPSLPRRLPTEG